MARTSTKSANENKVAVENTATNLVAEEKKNENKKVAEKEITDDEEIEMISLIPNVSYKDKKTGDTYSWETVGQIEMIPFSEIRDMHRNFRSYFTNMYLKPNDDRVIKKLNLNRNYDKYDFVMNEKNYTSKNIDKLCSEISSAPNGLKFSIVNKVSDLVKNKKITDITVIRRLEKLLNVDLISIYG